MPLNKKILTFAFSLLITIFVISPSYATEDLSPSQREQVIQLIRKTLTENPEIIMEALDELRQRREVAEAAQKQKVLSENKAIIFNDLLTPVAGNLQGDVSLVEFFDYRCGYCKRVFPAVMELVKSDTNLRYVIKEFPILGEESLFAAKAALAAKKQNKYFEMHVALMSVQGGLTNSKVMATAKSLGLDIETLKTDMEAEDVKRALQNNYALAQSLGITGTPAFIIGDEVVPGAIGLDQLKALIAEARNQSAQD